MVSKLWNLINFDQVDRSEVTSIYYNPATDH